MSEIREAQIWEDGMRLDPHKKTFEWWYFDANFKDGSTLVVTFFTKEAQNAAGPLNPLIQIVYTDPSGNKKRFNKNYSPLEFKASTEKCDVAMGRSSVSGDLKKYKLNLDLPEIKGEMEFDRVAPSYSTTKDRDVKPEAFGWFPSVPFGKVKADLEIEGKSFKSHGTGYHDHNWGTMNMKDIISYWYWGRGNAGNIYVIYSIMYLPKILGGRHASIMYLAEGDKILVGESNHLELTSTDINPPRPKVGHLPSKLSFTNTGIDGNITFTLSNPKLIESTDPTKDSKKSLVSRALGMFSNPLYVRYNSDFEIDIDLKNKKEKKTGESLYEIMILR